MMRFLPRSVYEVPGRQSDTDIEDFGASFSELITKKLTQQSIMQ